MPGIYFILLSFIIHFVILYDTYCLMAGSLFTCIGLFLILKTWRTMHHTLHAQNVDEGTSFSPASYLSYSSFTAPYKIFKISLVFSVLEAASIIPFFIYQRDFLITDIFKLLTFVFMFMGILKLSCTHKTKILSFIICVFAVIHIAAIIILKLFIKIPPQITSKLSNLFIILGIIITLAAFFILRWIFAFSS